MSEPVTNAEIEDVLSAVRRLVSESGVGKRDVGEERSALVLTPDFRVDDKVAKPEPDQDPSVEDMVQEALAEVGEAPVREDSDTYEVTPDPTTVSHDPDQSARASDAGAGRETAAADETLRTLEDRIAELESVVGDEPAEWEPDGSEAAETLDKIVFRHATAEEQAAPEDPVAETPMVEVPDLETADAWEDVSEIDITLAETPLEAEDDPLDAYDYTPETPDFGVSETTGEDGDDLVIDEDMLREIVARLVREELQGTMGERITRNLRRMVRREIARALALKDFD